MRTQLATWLSGGTVSLPSFVAIGNGTTIPSPGDSVLVNEVWRKPISTRFSRGSYAARINAIFTTDEPPVPPGSASANWTEIGLFDTGAITLANANFEMGTASWTYVGGVASTIGSIDTGTVYQGTAALKITFGTATTQVYQEIASPTTYASKKLEFQGAIRTVTASIARVFMTDGVGTTYSTYHSGVNEFQLKRVSRTLDATPTRLRVGYEVASAGTAWVDWSQLVQIGNLWFRQLIGVTKTATQPISVAMELYFDEQNEEGNVPYTAFAKETLTVAGTAVGFTSATYAPAGQTPAQEAIVTVEGGPIRYWKDSSTPTATAGHLIGVGGAFILETADEVANFKAIRVTATSATLVTSFRR